ncbi:nhaS3 [Symbiodinium sp. CCMP2592]|nr:nhaS3 [Symbiodinium sp. CCMP2592]
MAIPDEPDSGSFILQGHGKLGPIVGASDVRIGVVSTLRDVQDQLLHWLEWFRLIGFAHMFLYFDDPEHDEAAIQDCTATYSGDFLSCARNGQQLQEEWQNLRMPAGDTASFMLLQHSSTESLQRVLCFGDSTRNSFSCCSGLCHAYFVATMGGASSYIAMLCIAGFLGATWTASKVSRLLGVSDIVLVITTGVILGPDILGLVAKEYSVCSEARHADCSTIEDVTYKMANNMPLGQALGRIQNMDACDPADYHHDDHGSIGDGHGHGEDASHGTMPGATNETHGGEHAADGGHAADGPAHEHSAENHSAGGGHSTAGDHSTSGEHSTHGDHSDHSTSGAHSEGHSSPADHSGGEHGAAADHDAHQVSHGSGHRRLSGGGSYTSYEECLVKTCDADISHECQLTPDVFTLIGHAGVALMIFESGMHFDFEKAKVVGPKACVVAVIGTVLPLVSGAALTMLYGKPFFPHGISAGTALAPTSVGIALRLLGEAGVLQENFGQAIITAAFVDDILSLVLFNVLFSLGGEFDVMAVVVNPCIGVAVMLFAMYLAMKFWPKFINEWLLPKVPVKEGAKVPQTDEVLFLLMIFLLIGYGTITYFLGTHLWGCFIAGMSFACLNPPHHAHHVWVKQTKRVTSWMIRIFFACTVAFSIPISKLLSVEAIWKGAIMGIGPCIITKVCCAPFMGEARWVIGWAMVGRAEFAYLIAQMAAAANMLDKDMFSIVIWALLWATIFAPFIFRYVLNRYVRAQGLGDREPNPGYGEDEDGYSISEPPSEKGDLASDQDYKMKVEELNKVAPAEASAPSGARSSEARCCGAFSKSVV